MKWVLLDFANLPAIESQVEEVVKTHDALAEQLRKKKGNVNQIARAQEVLRQMMQQRIVAMERFYQEFDLDPRSQRVENCRIKLKRVMKGLDVPPAGSSLTTTQAQDNSNGAAEGEKASSSRGVGASSARGPSATATATGGTTRGSPPNRGGASRGSSATMGGRQQGQHLGQQLGLELHTTGTGEGGSDSQPITLKIQMTHSEFEVLRMRREAMKDLAKCGGKAATGQAWENAFSAHHNRATQGLDSHTQGTHTFHDIPYQDQASAKEQQALQRRSSFVPKTQQQQQQQPPFRTTNKASPRADPGFISTGAYHSANSEVVSRTLRYQNNADAMRGGTGAMDRQNSFKTVVPRTRVLTSGHKAESIGGLGY